MADDKDEKEAALGQALAEYYARLANTCELLPVPIQLPVGVLELTDITVPVARTAKLASDLPMPARVRTGLQVACLGWLTGAEMFKALVQHDEDPEDYRFGCAGLALMTGDQGLDAVITWLEDQE